MRNEMEREACRALQMTSKEFGLYPRNSGQSLKSFIPGIDALLFVL